MTLTFVERHEHHSTYTDREGGEWFIRHGWPRTEMVEDIDREWLIAKWRAYPKDSWNTRVAQEFFLAMLRTWVTDEDLIEEVAFCKDCLEPEMRDDGSYVRGGSWLCESCRDDSYSCCGSCDEYDTDTNYINGSTICEGCTDRYYSYCDDCEEYYGNDDGGHDHGGENCCSSPALDFVVRNDGQPLLANDTRVGVSLAAGLISDEGLLAIRNLLCREGVYAASDLVPDLGNQWQAKDGNFTKRLSRLVYNTHKQAIPAALLSQIGCVARDHSTAVDFHIELTRDLNQSAAAFYHEDSCWWRSYYRGRCALKSNGGFAIRTFEDGQVAGRAFVMPLTTIDDSSNLAPTFETLHPNAFVVFNGYGNLGGYAPARIISHMAGWTYRKITFTCDPMFVNGHMGYLVAPEEIAKDYTDGSLSLYVEEHADLYATTSTTRELIHV